jgi:hypothetical protein
MDPDPDLAIFITDLQDAKKTNFFCLLILSEGTFSSCLKDEKSQNSRNQGFSYYFCLMIEGSGAGDKSVSGAGFGSAPLTNGSGSRRPKNIPQHCSKVMSIGQPPEDCWRGRAGNPVELVPLYFRHEEMLVVAVVAEAVDQAQELYFQRHLPKEKRGYMLSNNMNYRTCK